MPRFLQGVLAGVCGTGACLGLYLHDFKTWWFALAMIIGTVQLIAYVVDESLKGGP